jgi:DnaJ-class molecular chaperone
MTRTYPILCPSCGGRGWIGSTLLTSSNAGETCPACGGGKTVYVTERDDEITGGYFAPPIEEKPLAKP